MKKVLSVLLALILVFSFASTAFAAGNTVEVGKKASFSIGINQTKEYTAEIDESGVYCLEAELIGTGVAELTVSYGGYGDGALLANLEKFVDDDFYFSKSEMNFAAEAGTEVEVEFNTNFEDYEDILEGTEIQISDFGIEFTLSKVDAKPITVGSNTVDRDDKYFTFVPEKDGYYNFRSNAADDTDSAIWIYDGNCEIDFNNDSGCEDDMNFDLTVYLKAGHFYAVNTKAHCYDEETIRPYNFTVSYNKEIKAEGIILGGYLESGETIVTDIGERMVYSISVVPNGATPLAKVSAAVANEEIASADCYDEDGSKGVCITTHKAGTTTLTLSTEDGCESEYTIIVRPMYVTIFENIILSIIGFFIGGIEFVMSLFGF